MLFVGTCLYSNMLIDSPANPKGDFEKNKKISKSHMNDYRYGLISVERSSIDNAVVGRQFITPDDYVRWFEHGFSAMDTVISENEKKENPLPVVVVTHYPMIREIAKHSFYVEPENRTSYCSDMKFWFDRHPSIKCHCCGHCHDMAKGWRYFKLDRPEMDKLLVVNNSFGYAFDFHEATFNLNRFVDTDTWEVIETPESDDVKKAKEEKFNRLKVI